MTDSQTIADEWVDYVENVLSKNPDITPEMAESLRTIFFSGATAMFSCLARCGSPAALLTEIKQHAASIRGRVQ